MDGETQRNDQGCDAVERVPPGTLQLDEHEGSTLSSITPQVIATPERITEKQQHVEMGLPPTPPLRTLNIPEQPLLEEGYDSDMQRGPFYQDGVRDEMFFDMSEDAPEVVEAILLPDDATENIENSTTTNMLTDEQIGAMKVVELRTELEKRGMSKNGLKNVLIQRLKEAVKNNVQLLEARPDDEVQNLAGDGFDGNSYWKLLEQAGPEIDESGMEIEGITFRAPTTSEAEQHAECQDRAKKRNYDETFDRMPFSAERLLPEKNLRGCFKKDRNGSFIYKKQPTTETIPNIEYLLAKKVGLDSHPADWFELFFQEKKIDQLTQKLLPWTI